MYSYYNNYPTNSSLTSGLSSLGTFSIIAFIVAICAAIVIYAVFMTKDNEKNLNSTTKKIYDFLHFKKLYIEEFLKIAYLISAIYLTIISFGFISTSVGLFFGMLIIGNILLRFAYELMIMGFKLFENVCEINKKMK
jgi:hypothetical protein